VCYVIASCSQLSRIRVLEISECYINSGERIGGSVRARVCVVENCFICRRENGTRFSQDDFCYVLISVSVGCKR
jgi:hypothetical protein